MTQNNVQTEDISIERVDKIREKYLVKFDKIDIPIEMNESYFKNVLKHLQN